MKKIKLLKKSVSFYLILSVVSAFPFTAAATTIERGECVVLLHGLGRSYRSMESMTQALEEAGFDTANIDYPSQDETIEKLAAEAVPKGLQKCREIQPSKIHFVTHSMGGILLRYYTSLHTIEKLGRTVMLSPPNRGSEVADNLKDWSTYQWFNGPAGQQLGTTKDSLVMRLGPVDFPLGVITGNSPAFFDSWLADMIHGPNDGKVSVERAKIDGMKDFLVLPYSHTFIMDEEDVIIQTIHFLENEFFSHPPEKMR